MPGMAASDIASDQAAESIRFTRRQFANSIRCRVISRADTIKETWSVQDIDVYSPGFWLFFNSHELPSFPFCSLMISSLVGAGHSTDPLTQRPVPPQ